MKFTKEEKVWLKIYTSAILANRLSGAAEQMAIIGLAQYRKNFPYTIDSELREIRQSCID